MDIIAEHWPLLTFKEYEKDINPTPIYQRSSVWHTDQKQMLMDSILRKIDIPKIYLRKLRDSNFQYEIVDGQQRMRTMWDFLNNKLRLIEESEKLNIGGVQYPISGMFYKELNTKVQVERVYKYTLDVIIISDASEDEIADLFYRLNNGTPLSPAEVRNSMPGEMKNAIKLLSSHSFFKKVSFSDFRYAHDQVCAQMMMLELNHGTTDIQDKYLTKMYSDHKRSVPRKTTDNVRNTLDVLDALFPEKSRLLNRASTINLYLLISYLLKTAKLTKVFYSEFLKWYLKTEPVRRRKNEYHFYMTKSANSRQSIEGRFRILLIALQKKFNNIGLIKLDPKRNFSEKQKTEIFSRDNGMCKNCGIEVTERVWHADHKLAWIRGGKTEFVNGQLLCVQCNLKKKDKLW